MNLLLGLWNIFVGIMLLAFTIGYIQDGTGQHYIPLNIFFIPVCLVVGIANLAAHWMKK